LKRDFFGSPLREAAAAALTGGNRVLEVFASQVYANEDVQEGSPNDAPVSNGARNRKVT
jgi:hypothetical protein